MNENFDRSLRDRVEQGAEWPTMTLSCGCNVRIRPGSAWGQCPNHEDEYPEEVSLNLAPARPVFLSCCGEKRPVGLESDNPCPFCGAC